MRQDLSRHETQTLKNGTGRYFCSPGRASQSFSRCEMQVHFYFNFLEIIQLERQELQRRLYRRLVYLRGKNLIIASSKWQKILQSMTSDDLNLKYDLFSHYFLSKFHVYMHCTCISLLLWQSIWVPGTCSVWLSGLKQLRDVTKKSLHFGLCGRHAEGALWHLWNVLRVTKYQMSASQCYLHCPEWLAKSSALWGWVLEFLWGFSIWTEISVQ